jgi:hypothetical protein
MEQDIFKDSQSVANFLNAAWKEQKGNVITFAGMLLSKMQSMTDDQRQVFLQMALYVAKFPPGGQKPGDLMVETIVSGRDNKPYVAISFDGARVQLAPDMARHHAEIVFSAAAVSESESFFKRFLTEKMDIPADASTALLVLFRDYRASLYGKAVQ